MSEIQEQLDKLEAITKKIGQRADEILAQIERTKKDEIKEKYIVIADQMCKNYCVIPRMYCYDGRTAIEGMSKHCDGCPLMKGYKEICI